MPQIEGETYFNNFGQSGYDELKEWTPSYYQSIKEADANLRFAGITIDQMAQALENWCANMFIDTMSEEMLSRMETFYYLDNSGAMRTGWVKENEKWYYMGTDGACFINTKTPDGYMVDVNGAWIDSKDNYDREELNASQEEESKKPSLEEVVEAYKAFIWYDFGMGDGVDNYLFIDLNNDGIPECIRRHYGKSNESGIGVGILTYSEGADYYGNQNCNMLFEDICIPFYYVEGGNAFYSYLGGRDGGERVCFKINDKGKFEFMEYSNSLNS